MTDKKLEQKAREFLAAEYERDGQMAQKVADIRAGDSRAGLSVDRAVRAIIAALARVQP